MPVYDPNAEHNKILKRPDRVVRKSDLEGKTIDSVVWGDELVYVKFEDDSLAEVVMGNLHSATAYGITLSDNNYSRLSAKNQFKLGYITEEEYERYKELKKEWKEKEKEKERRNRYERLREEFGPDLSDEEIEELEEMYEKLSEILD